jgi:hypothetical protein
MDQSQTLNTRFLNFRTIRHVRFDEQKLCLYVVQMDSNDYLGPVLWILGCFDEPFFQTEKGERVPE